MSERHDRMRELADQVVPSLQRYLRRRTDPQTAADVLADCLLVLWQRLDDVPAGAELPWSYGVARHCLANAERARRWQLRLVDRLAAVRWFATSTADVGPPPDRGGPPNLGGTPDPDANGDPQLTAALARLRPADREVLRLWAWEDLEPREIAEVLGVSANAASIRVHRARARLAKEYGDGPRTGEPSGDPAPHGKTLDFAGQEPDDPTEVR